MAGKVPWLIQKIAAIGCDVSTAKVTREKLASKELEDDGRMKQKNLKALFSENILGIQNLAIANPQIKAAVYGGKEIDFADLSTLFNGVNEQVNLLKAKLAARKARRTAGTSGEVKLKLINAEFKLEFAETHMTEQLREHGMAWGSYKRFRIVSDGDDIRLLYHACFYANLSGVFAAGTGGEVELKLINTWFKLEFAEAHITAELREHGMAWEKLYKVEKVANMVPWLTQKIAAIGCDVWKAKVEREKLALKELEDEGRMKQKNVKALFSEDILEIQNLAIAIPQIKAAVDGGEEIDSADLKTLLDGVDEQTLTTFHDVLVDFRTHCESINLERQSVTELEADLETRLARLLELLSQLVITPPRKFMIVKDSDDIRLLYHAYFYANLSGVFAAGASEEVKLKLINAGFKLEFADSHD
ncbi:OLC1v1010222C1 [Oldenlandia corymbosa var. corymbosa]|uniref:OLC1v1010222C1 n=1 Tax=Oldenlandia corymbosa var. corymbosa TaxID=529605 RepID=A0AAV1DR29_OLDCO|nr:OLC1v1010222C1 [Oldenlandia corymbosa var. corymbosa]